MSEIILCNNYKLEPMMPEHASDLAPIFNDPQNLRHIAKKDLNAEQLCLASQKHWEKNGFGMLAIIHQETNSVIGRGGFRLWQDTELHEGNIEYLAFIDHAHANQGLGTALAKHSLKYAFALPNTHIVQAITTPENTPSQRMLEKAGLEIMDYPITQTVDGNPVQYTLACQGIAMHKYQQKKKSILSRRLNAA